MTSGNCPTLSISAGCDLWLWWRFVEVEVVVAARELLVAVEVVKHVLY